MSRLIALVSKINMAQIALVLSVIAIVVGEAPPGN